MKRYFWFLLVLSGLTLISCDDEGESNEAADFDRTAMLQNYADNLIIPAYKELESSITDLEAELQGFLDTTSKENFDTLQAQWERTYLTWQKANAYNFGPAGEQGLQKSLIEEVGTWPVDTAEVNSRIISSGSYDLTDVHRDARGFLTLEYLIFSEPDSVIIDAYKTNTYRGDYSKDLVLNIKSRVTAIVQEWETSYRDEFILLNGTDVGSGTSIFYNEFVRSFEAIKNFKVGLPLGKRVPQTQSEPQLVECYYSGLSKKMIGAHLESIEAIWRGNPDDQTDNLGFQEYLNNVPGGAALVGSTESQLSAVKNAYDQVPDQPSLSQLIINGSQEVENLHTELQKHTRFFKSDMSSVLGISITFSSGDGD